MVAMLSVLTKRWLTNAWRPLEDATAKPMAMAFIEVLNTANVPYQHYAELYTRAIKLRANRLENGLKTEDFSVDLMLAAWPALKDELRERDIATGRMLPATASSDCDLCYGVGMRNIDGKGFGKCECLGA